MSYLEKINASTFVATLAVYLWYVSRIAPQLGDVPLDEIGFRWPMMIAIIAGIILAIVTSVIVSIVDAIAQRIRDGAEFDESEIGKGDERDREIERLGEAWTGHIISAGGLGVLALTWLEFEMFWVANALFSAIWLGSMAGIVVKLIAYRRGV